LNIFWYAVLLFCSFFGAAGFVIVMQTADLWNRAPGPVTGLILALILPAVMTGFVTARTGLGRMARLLRGRPDSEHEQAMLRILMLNLILYYVFALIVLKGHRPELVDSVLMFAVASCVSWLILLHLILDPRSSIVRRVVGNIADVTMVSVFLYIAGPPAAPWYLIYLWVTFGNGFRYGTPFLFVSTAMSLGGFFWVFRSTDYWREIPYVASGLLAALLVLPAYVARLIRRFLATVSHELRTPLTAIIGMGDMMIGTRLDPEQREMSSTIAASARQLLFLITDILDFSRIEEAKLAIDRAAFDLLEVLDATRLVLRGQAKAKGLCLRLLIDGQVPLRVMGDARRLQQALTNLLGNAVKFTESGEVVLSVRRLRRDGDRATLEFRVTDTGIGIDPRHIGRIFERFTQADDQINRRYGGTGLGLAISKQLVELMGGAIGVESAPGCGSSFWITLPVAVCPPPALPEATGLSAVVIGGNAEPRAWIAASLERRRLTVLQASGMDDARRMLMAPRSSDRAPALLIFPDGDPAADEVTRWLGSPVVPDRLAVILAGVDAVEGAIRTRGWQIETVLTCAADPEAVERAAAAMLGLGSGIARPDVAAPEPEPANDSRYRILVAEDNPVNRRVLEKILERAGHEAVFARDGDEALNRLDDGGFDVVLMGMNMPGTSGLDVARVYRFTHTDRPHLPIIALTAEATEAARRDCAEAGMDAFLTKPVDPHTLFATIRELIGGSAGSRGSTPVPAEAASPDGTPAGPSIDAAAFAKLRAIDPDPDFIAQLAAEFLTDAEELLFDLERAWAAGDLIAFKEHAHSLRSSASYIGALRLVRLLLDCRNVTRNDLPDEGHRLVRQAREEFVQVRNALQSWL
jgi:two-component system sensor histidine kinase RpfC